MTPDEDAVRKPTKFELALSFVENRLLSLVGIALLIGGAVVLVGYDIQLARWQLIVLYTGVAFAPVGLLLGRYLTALLYNPRRVYVVDLDATTVDGALFSLPYDDFRELTVTDEDGHENSGYQITRLTPNLYCAKNVDLENLSCVGTWRGTLDDRELVRCLGKVAECRGMLQEDARRGWALENSSFSLVRHAAQDEIKAVTESFADGTLATNGESVTEAIDRALADHELDEDLPEDLETMATPEEADPAAGDHADGPPDEELKNGVADTEVSADD